MKKFFWITMLVAVSLLFTGCGKQSTTINDDNTDRQEMSNSDVADCKQWCDLMANKNMSKDDCYKLCDTSQKLESNDISDCDEIEKTSWWFITKDICIQDKAIQTKDYTYCKSIEAEINKDSCYMSLASELKNKDLCENISNEILRTACTQEEVTE